MYFNKLNGNFLTQKHFECFEVNTISPKPNDQKNFVNGLQNARKLLDGLERSLRRTGKYEDQLIRCKATHAHSHDWWSSGLSDRECGSMSEVTQPRGQINLAESWSTMSIVCLQYQYEELSKKYTALLHAYHESCNSSRGREAALARLRAHTRRALKQLALAHRTLVAIGEKYLSLRRKKLLQKNKYEHRINRLQATVRGVMAMCEHARLQLDTRLMRYMQTERDAPNAQLLVEIRKCNLLFLENLRLKAQIEEMSPGKVFVEEH